MLPVNMVRLPRYGGTCIFELVVSSSALNNSSKPSRVPELEHVIHWTVYLISTLSPMYVLSLHKCDGGSQPTVPDVIRLILSDRG